MQVKQRRGIHRQVLCTVFTFIALNVYAQTDKKPAITPKPAMTVTVAQPQSQNLSERLSANGTVSAWQEASVGAEIGGLRLTEVRVNVGDQVTAGQVLAVFSNDNVIAEINQAKAALNEAKALVMEAKANADRARALEPSGVISAQQFNKDVTAEATAQARESSCLNPPEKEPQELLRRFRLDRV
jgi:multidrug efflux pump subunit AcrA (membrane-fusion protein)